MEDFCMEVHHLAILALGILVLGPCSREVAMHQGRNFPENQFCRSAEKFNFLKTSEIEHKIEYKRVLKNVA